MQTATQRNVLSGLVVADAMRRQIIRLSASETISQAIRSTIKFKVNSVLIDTDAQQAVGVVSKTDLMSAYYAGFDLETPLEAIMVGPPILCRPDDPLDEALKIMQTHDVHRLYIKTDGHHPVIGVLAYPDIVGILYRFCRRCEKSATRRKQGTAEENWAEMLMVREVMTPKLIQAGKDQTLSEVMELLSANRLGAVLVHDDKGLPLGVVSKTDLIAAYMHELDPARVVAANIMKGPPLACEENDLLSETLWVMIYNDVYRMFVFRNRPENMVGVLSLSDAARFRSGSCKACLSSRIQL